jgi:hypothetical protein
MGTFAGRGAAFDQTAIAEVMRPALYATFNARIQILDPNLDEILTPYDPVSDTGGQAASVAVLYDSGPAGALIQPIRSPVAVQNGEQTTFILGIRFQCKMPATPTAFRAGLRVRVLDGGNVHELERYTYTLTEGFDSSLAWGKTIEATTVTSGVG